LGAFDYEKNLPDTDSAKGQGGAGKNICGSPRCRRPTKTVTQIAPIKAARHGKHEDNHNFETTQ